MMMEKMSSASSHLIIKIIFGVIIVSFLLSGIGGYLNFTAKPYVAKVNGYKINPEQFDAALQSVLSQQDLSTLSENAKQQKTAQIKQELLQIDINNILLGQYAKKTDYYVPDAVVSEQILTMPVFQVNGKFDNATFKSILANNGLTPTSFAELKRNSLEQTTLFNSILQSNFALPVDSNVSKLRNQERDVKIATLPLSKVKVNSTITSQDIQQYYDKHKSEWAHPEQVQVSYIELPESQNTSNIKISTQDIQQYYDAHKSSYTTQARDNYSEIIVTTQSEADSLLKQLQGGADFAKLSEQNSIYPFLKKQKGELGWFNEGKAPQQIIDAKLTTKNPISNVVAYDGGYAIFKLNKSEPASTKSLSEVSTQIKQLLTKQQQDSAFRAEQEKLQSAIGKKASLEELAKLANVKISQSDWISSGKLPKNLDNNAIRQAIFSSGLFDQSGPVNITSDVVSNGSDAFVFKVSKYRAAGILPLSDVETQVKNDIQTQREETALQQQASLIVNQLNEGKNDLAKQDGIIFNKTDKLTQSSTSLPASVINGIFTSARPVNGKPVYGYVVTSGQSATLFEITNVKNASSSTDLSNEMDYVYGMMDKQMLLDSLNKAASIKINTDDQS